MNMIIVIIKVLVVIVARLGVLLQSLAAGGGLSGPASAIQRFITTAVLNWD